MQLQAVEQKTPDCFGANIPRRFIAIGFQTSAGTALYPLARAPSLTSLHAYRVLNAPCLKRHTLHSVLQAICLNGKMNE